MKESTTLLCTVGGSHEPIVDAIRALRPARVCFVCSLDDPATGRKGSYTQITGKGLFLKAHWRDDKPSLPNIPTQAGLAEEAYEILKVRPDDFDDIYGRIVAWLAERDPGRERLVADYTGGTKSMSAALATAALDTPGVELQLVTGARSDLVKVASGTQTVVPANVEATRFRRRLREALSPWSRFAYDEAAALLDALPAPRSPELMGEYQRARALSTAFAAWDRFDHARALAGIEPYRPLLGRLMAPWLGVLGQLNRDAGIREPLRLLDLWRNAQRRAAQGRYDDAVARLYRLLEWTAQWLLGEYAQIRTDDISADEVPPGMDLAPGRDGRIQAGLYAAWELAAHHCPGVDAFWAAQKKRMLHLLQGRNGSILAHGFAPLGENDWEEFAAWIEKALLPLLLEHAGKRHHLKAISPQLPADYSPFAGVR